MADRTSLPSVQHKPPRYLVAFTKWLSWALLVVVLLRTAWVCDDAFITMRCVDNATNGYGLTFNPAERVQAFTHPLWALFLLAAHILFDSAYFELALSGLICSLAAMLLLAQFSRAPWAWLCLPLLAISSKALIEYSSSGLENPLSYVLLVLFAAEALRERTMNRSAFRLALIASAIGLNRIDLLVIIAPAMATFLWQERSWRTLKAVALGFSPLFAWEAFALFYYGFPFPNTAYAKLGAGIPQGELWTMGRRYFEDSLQRDWVTLPLLLVASLSALTRKREAPIAVGILLYLLYVLRIGGDFMSGRFFAVPLVLSLFLLCRFCADSGRRWLSLVGPATALGLLSPTPMLLSGADCTLPREILIGPSGVADERAFYYHGTGLLIALEGQPMPTHPLVHRGKAQARVAPRTLLASNIGMRGYFGGPDVHIIDGCALSDPLLARMPAVIRSRSRAGHFLRRVPAGYFETVDSGPNVIEDPDLAELYDQLELIVRGSLLSAQRLKAIWKANTAPFPERDLGRFRLPLDRSLRLERDLSKSASVSSRNSWHVAWPRGSCRVELEITGRPFCDLIWLRDREPHGSVRLNSVQTYLLDIPQGVTGMALLREGSERKCEVRGLIAHGD